MRIILVASGEEIGQYVAKLSPDLQEVFKFLERRDEELKTAHQKWFKCAILMYLSPAYRTDALKALEDMWQVAKRLDEDKAIFCDEVRARLGINKSYEIVVTKNCEVYFLYPVCGECKRRHSSADVETEAVALSFVLGAVAGL